MFSLITVLFVKNYIVLESKQKVMSVNMVKKVAELVTSINALFLQFVKVVFYSLSCSVQF